MYDVHHSAEVRQLYYREHLSKTTIARRLGMSRPTVIRLLELTDPPRYRLVGLGPWCRGHPIGPGRMSLVFLNPEHVLNVEDRAVPLLEPAQIRCASPSTTRSNSRIATLSVQRGSRARLHALRVRLTRLKPEGVVDPRRADPRHVRGPVGDPRPDAARRTMGWWGVRCWYHHARSLWRSHEVSFDALPCTTRCAWRS